MTQTLLSIERTKEQCNLLAKTWDTLNEVTVDLESRGVKLTPEVYTSLRSAKILITQCQTHPNPNEIPSREIDSYLGFCVGCCGQNVVTRIKCELQNVEDHLIIHAINEVGQEYGLRLQQKTVKAWEPLHERIVSNIENLDQAIKVEKDVLSAYQSVIDEKISYWIAVEEDIVDSYRKLADQNENIKLRAALTKLVEDSREHIEVLRSIRENFRKIAAEEAQHGKMLEELAKVDPVS